MGVKVFSTLSNLEDGVVDRNNIKQTLMTDKKKKIDLLSYSIISIISYILRIQIMYFKRSYYILLINVLLFFNFLIKLDISNFFLFSLRFDITRIY